MRRFKNGFTLAEVLITLAIIGVVAALTIPALSSKTNEKGLNTSDSVFQRRLGEALKIMNLQGTLQGHQNTQKFVNELSKHIKIIKTCDSEHLSECFSSEFKSDEETIKVKDLKKSKNLYKDNDYKTETIGAVFNDGIRALIAYNPNCRQDQFNNSNKDDAPVKLITSTKNGKNKTVKLETDSLSILYNLQERKNNNIYSATDNIRGLNISIPKCNGTKLTHNGIKYCYLDTNYQAINTCNDNTYDTHGKDNPYCSSNRWAGAQKACADMNMRLPNRYEGVSSWFDKTMSSKSSGYFWSSSDYSDITAGNSDIAGNAYVNSFNDSNCYGTYKNVLASVLCIGN